MFMPAKIKARSTAEQVTEGLDLSDKTVVVTGVNSGLGYETMRVLTSRGAHVIGAARSMDKATTACGSVQGKTTPVACELSDMDSVAACAKSILDSGKAVDVLICNAGIMALPELHVIDGLELQFLTNHMGHFLLTYLLQEPLKAAPQGRIVMLSSLAHILTVRGGINFDNLDGSKGYRPWPFYGQSKLADLLSARAFNDHLAGTRVSANAVHPGVINTNLARDVTGPLGWFQNNRVISSISDKFLTKTIPQGASTQCYVATSPELKGVGGKYFADNAEGRPSKYARSDSLKKKLWEFSLDYLDAYIA
jgi:NAD(P)-dependent dehydrogenase (short-subunit alcohol dehydrogenase family)